MEGRISGECGVATKDTRLKRGSEMEMEEVEEEIGGGGVAGADEMFEDVRVRGGMWRDRDRRSGVAAREWKRGVGMEGERERVELKGRGTGGRE